MRSCVACRQSAPPRGLLRFVRGLDGAVALDVRGRLDGRGAYTCAQPGCLRRAREKGAFGHAFAAPVVFDDGFVERVPSVLRDEIVRGLALHRRAGRAVYGRDRVLEAAPQLSLLVLAEDGAANTRRDILEKAAGLAVHQGPAKATLGHVFGREAVAVVGVMDLGSATARLRDDLSRYGHFSASTGAPVAGGAPCDENKEGVEAPKESVVTQ